MRSVKDVVRRNSITGYEFGRHAKHGNGIQHILGEWDAVI
jgi:hypothetical protein